MRMRVLRVVGWLVFVVLALVKQNCCAMNDEEASYRLQVTIEGCKLMWQFHWNQSTVAGPDPVIHYSVSVYTSLPPDNTVAVSELTTDTSFDLNILSLEEGTYYVQVQADIPGVEGGVCSEVTLYNATSSGNTSHETSFTSLLITISCVLAAAVLVGSILFAVTMWKMRAQGRRQHTRDSTRSQSSVKTSILSCVLCPCIRSCERRESTCGGAQSGLNSRDGLQLHSIETRDKNKRLVPLYLPNRDFSASHSARGAGTSKASKEASLEEQQANNDLPYGYLSPSEINIPRFQRKKSTVSEERPGETSQSTPATVVYVNIERLGDASRPVNHVKTVERNASSLSESIYSIPCSHTASVEEDEVYNNTLQYMEIIPP